MENLNYPVQRFLITNLSNLDFGLYTHTDQDVGGTTNVLLLKKFALSLKYSSTGTSISVSRTKDGALKSVLLKTNAPAPCADCNYEYGIIVKKRRQQPGVQNDDYYSKGRYYGDVITSIQTPSGGQLADSDKLTIENKILLDIKNDQDTDTREPSIAKAKRLYKITRSAATDEVAYTVNGVAGTNVVLGATAILSVNNLNADAGFVAAGLVAFALSTTVIAITSVSDGTSFTVADGGGATTITTERFLWIYAKDVEAQFDVEFDKDFMTLSRFNVAVLNNTSAAAGNTVLAIAGTASGNLANHATSTTYAGTITTWLSTNGFASATKTTGSVPVYVYTGVVELKIKSLGTAGVTLTTQYSGNGVWPGLTWKEVFNKFINQRDLGDNLMMVPHTTPQPGEKYNKITIKTSVLTGAIHGASHKDYHESTIELYIKQGAGSTQLWDASNYMWESTDDDATFAVDTAINALFTAWGVTPSPTIL